MSGNRLFIPQMGARFLQGRVSKESEDPLHATLRRKLPNQGITDRTAC